MNPIDNKIYHLISAVYWADNKPWFTELAEKVIDKYFSLFQPLPKESKLRIIKAISLQKDTITIQDILDILAVEQFYLNKPELRDKITSPKRKATAKDYVDWLSGWLKLPNSNITHLYYRDFDNSKMYVALMDCYIADRACGAVSFDIIVPEGIQITRLGYDHCELYKMDYQYSFDRTPSVPLYIDVAKMLLQDPTLSDQWKEYINDYLLVAEL